MIDYQEIKLKKAILHILDNRLNIPVLSEEELILESDIKEYLEKHIHKLLQEESLKKGTFIPESNAVEYLCQNLSKEQQTFSQVTKEISMHLYDLMVKHVDIPPADFICCVFDMDTVPYLGLMKFNYKYSFIHYVEELESKRVNSIIKQPTALPTENQRIEECAFINLQDLSIFLLEKKYEINGHKEFYFSKLFLNCNCDLSTGEKVKVFKKTTEKFIKDYYNEDFKKMSNAKMAVSESIEENNYVDIPEVAQKIFPDEPKVREEFIQTIEDKGIKEEHFAINEKIEKRNFKKHKFVTNSGIELSVPVEYVDHKDVIEFVNNQDGTISIVIKNVGNMKHK